MTVYRNAVWRRWFLSVCGDYVKIFLVPLDKSLHWSYPFSTEFESVTERGIHVASITKRGNAYLIRRYAGYTADGKQITKMMTWHPEPGMSEAKALKEAQRQAIMFEDSIKFGTTDNTHIKFQQYSEIWRKSG